MTALVLMTAATPALAQSATTALRVSVVVTRSCAVATASGSSTSAQVTLACSRGTTPALVGITAITPRPIPMSAPADAAPLASIPNAAAATSSQMATIEATPASAATIAAAAAVAAAAEQARHVVPVQTVTLLAPSQAIDGGSGQVLDRDRLVTINF
jgi:hypothetical protein